MVLPGNIPPAAAETVCISRCCQSKHVEINKNKALFEGFNQAIRLLRMYVF